MRPGGSVVGGLGSVGEPYYSALEHLSLLSSTLPTLCACWTVAQSPPAVPRHLCQSCFSSRNINSPCVFSACACLNLTDLFWLKFYVMVVMAISYTFLTAAAIYLPGRSMLKRMKPHCCLCWSREHRA